MDVLSAFPGRYLKAADLGGKPQSLKIASIDYERVGDDGNKLVMRFDGSEQGFVLNKTNSQLLVEELGGSETSDWIGQEITLYPTRVQFGAKVVPAIRVQTANDVLAEASQ